MRGRPVGKSTGFVWRICSSLEVGTIVYRDRKICKFGIKGKLWKSV